MSANRLEGIGRQAKGSVQDAAGKLTGDAGLQAKGKANKLAGKVQNAAGSAQDAARGRL